MCCFSCFDLRSCKKIILTNNGFCYAFRHGEDLIADRLNLLAWTLNERLRRIVCAAEVKVLGLGGDTAVSQATGVSRRAILAGMRELVERPPGKEPSTLRVQRAGGGRKKVRNLDPTPMSDLESLVEPLTQGDSKSPL